MITHQIGTIVQSDKFNVGDIICALDNYEAGIPIFFKATSYDVSIYSNIKRQYIKLIINK